MANYSDHDALKDSQEPGPAPGFFFRKYICFAFGTNHAFNMECEGFMTVNSLVYLRIKQVQASDPQLIG